MSKKHIVRLSASQVGGGSTDWTRVDALTDADIEKAFAEDPDAPPLLDEEWFRTAEVFLPVPKAPISIRLNRDVLDWFKAQGPGYQSRINAVLTAYVKAHRKTG
jgi:uncharacterized protein (DUF4415 family)